MGDPRRAPAVAVVLLVAGLFLHGCAGPAPAPSAARGGAGGSAAAGPARGPSHRVWQQHFDAAQGALERRELQAAGRELLAAVDQALRFPPSDPRAARTAVLSPEVVTAVEHGVSPKAALDLARELESRARESGDPTHPVALGAAQSLWTLLVHTGRREEAKEVARALHAASEERLGPDHPTTIRSLLTRAESLAADERAQARELLALALERARRVHGPRSYEVALAYRLAGALDLADGRVERAIDHWTRALEAGESSASSRMLAGIELALGQATALHGDLDGAELRLRRAHAYYRLEPGPGQDGVGVSQALARVYYMRGDVQAALGASRRAIDAVESAHGAESPALVDLLALRAWLQLAAGREEEAASNLGRTLLLVEGIDYDGLRERMPLLDVAVLAVRMGRTAEALRLAEEGHARAARRRGERVLADVQDANDYAYVLLHAGDAGRAEEIVRAALALVEETVGRNALLQATCEETLGMALAAQGAPRRALPHLVHAEKRIERTLGAESALLYEIWEHREDVLVALGRRRDAEALRARRAAWVAARRAAAPAEGEPQWFELPEHNFRLAHPGDPWVEAPPEAPTGDGRIELVRSDPPMRFEAHASAGPVSDPEDFVGRLAKGEVDDRPLEVLSQEPLALAGVEGIRVRGLERRPSGEVWYVDVWYGVHNGYGFELTGWGRKQEVRAEHAWEIVAGVREGFELLDPDRAAPQGFSFRSERYGLSVEMDRGAWLTIASGAPTVDGWELKAVGSDGALALKPIALFGMRPSDAVVASGLLAAAMGAALPEERRPVVAGGGRGLEFEVSTPEMRFRARTLQRDDVAVLVLVTEGSEQASALLDSVRLAPGFEPDVRGEALADDERAAYARAYAAMERAALAEGDLELALAVLQRGALLDPGDPSWVEELADLASTAGRTTLAARALSAALERFPERSGLWVRLAVARSASGDRAGAIEAYRRAFELGFDDDGHFRQYVQALWDSGARDEARERLDARIEASGATSLRAQRASFLRQSGALEQAGAELRELERQAPDDTELLAELLLVHLQTGDYAEVVAVSDRLLALVPVSADVMYVKAQALVALGRFTEAKPIIDRAAALQPGSDAIQTLQQTLAGLAGQGSRTGIREPIEPVAVPAALRPPRDAGAPEAAADFGAYFGFWGEVLDHRTGERWRRSSHLELTVLDSRGIQQFSTLRFGFHPLAERIFVNEVTVRDPAGAVTGRGDPEDAYVLDASEGQEASSEKVLHVPVPGLAIGHTVELVVTREGRSPPNRFQYLDHVFSQSVPVVRSLLCLTGDFGELVVRESGSLREVDGDGWIAWIADRPEAFRWEPLQSRGLEHVPRVRIADGGDSWESVTQRYLADLEPHLAAHERIPPLAERTLAGASTPAERLRHIADFVQGELRYEAIVFGRQARIPKGIERTLRDRYGDCKDHSLLLLQLLREAGFEADLALVSSSLTVDADVPSLDQFDHMLVRCADCDGVRYLDATDKHASLGSSAPRQLAGRRVLVLDPERPRLESIPPAETHTYHVHIERVADVSESGDVSVREEVTLAGGLAASIRAGLRSVDRLSWNELLQREILSDRQSVSVRAIEVANPDRLHEPLRLAVEYDVPKAFSRSEDGIAGRIPVGWERTLLEVEAVDSRRSHFEIAQPLELSSRSRLRLPEGFRSTDAGFEDAGSSQRFVRWTGSATPRSDGVVLDYSAFRPAGTHPARDYRPYFDEVEEALSFLDQRIHLRRSLD